MHQGTIIGKKRTKYSIQDLCMMGVFAAAIAIMAQIAIPMPGGVPITLQTFAVTVAAIILGAKRGCLSVFIYLLLGATGLPVFAGFTGGLSRLVGPTSGFLLSFPVMAYLVGLGVEFRKKWKGAFICFLVLGMIVNYASGVLFFCVLTESPLSAGITACVLPFLPIQIPVEVAAAMFGFAIRKRLPARI